MNQVFDMTGNVQDGTGDYDLRFGDTFYDFTWFAGFDQAETLARVTQPSVLLHTAASAPGGGYYDEAGVLLSAMDGDDARRAHDLLPDDELVDGIESGHDIHAEKPGLFVDTLVEFLGRVQ
jgi:pimeloyl-ACP methyl ester carboxylesterase